MAHCEDHCSRRMSLKALVVHCVAFIVVVVGYHASPVNGLVCHCMVGFDDLRDTEPCDNVTNTRMCATGGVCAVWLAGEQVVQRCIYDQLSIQTCSNSDMHLCCNMDLCNGVDNFTEFRASQTNNNGSSTNIATSSSSSITSSSSGIASSSSGIASSSSSIASSSSNTVSSSSSMINLVATPSAVGLVCHCTVGFDDRRDPEPCNTDNNTRTCAPGGVCAVQLSNDGRVIQFCMYEQLPTRTCSPTSNTHWCCRVDLCNSIDNFTEFRASQTNNIESSTNTAASSSSSMTDVVITPSTVAVNATPTVNVSAASSSSDSSPPPYAIALIVVLSFIILVVAIIIMAILSMYCFSWYRNSKQPIKVAGSTCTIDVSSVDITVSTSDWSAGSDSGLPVLFQAHIARQITREHLIGRGRYGQVWRGYYKGEDVAVKVFQSIEETSWLHEVDIYNKCGLRHPNILRFIAADRSDAGMFIENWLIAEYCENGNLYDYLQCYVLAEATVVAMAHDIASGLVFIHSVITGTEGKASIAHRDLKSRNILVKKDLSLVIGDFGLAIRHDVNNDTVEEPPTQRVGTKRYLAPEILDGTMNMNIFDSFKRADIYSFGLVLWEIVRRGQCNGVVEEPQLPYYDCVPCDPSFEEMQNVVCVEQRRPLIPVRWYQSPVFSGLAKLLNECWHHSGEARLKALRVRRRLEDILHKNCDKNDSPKSTAKPS